MPDPDTRCQGLFWPGVLAGMGIAGTLDEVRPPLPIHPVSPSPPPSSVSAASTSTTAPSSTSSSASTRSAPTPPTTFPYDLAFLAIAATLAIGGALLLRTSGQPIP